MGEVERLAFASMLDLKQRWCFERAQFAFGACIINASVIHEIYSKVSFSTIKLISTLLFGTIEIVISLFN